MSADDEKLIAGKWVATGSTFDSVNPATGELVSRCAEASQQELDAAVVAACDAFPAWRKTPPPRRAEILFRVAELLKARKDDLARWITLEMGKVTMEARGDVQEAIDMARYMAGEGRRMFGHVVPPNCPTNPQRCAGAVGVVRDHHPLEFPIAIPAWKMFPALDSRQHGRAESLPATLPLCGGEFVQARGSGMPPGVVNLVLGKGQRSGRACQP